jgi:hypothetical protein
VARQNFQVLVCQRFHCPTSEYEERVFRKCLYWHARLLAPVVRRLKSDFFTEDFKFIRYLGGIFGDFSGWVGAERGKAFRVEAVGTA